MIKFFGIFEENRNLSTTVTVVIAALIFAFSSIPGQSQPLLYEMNILSVIYHFSIFFLLTVFLLISMHGKDKPNKDYILIGIIVVIFYAILDEIHQMFIPLRVPSIGDVFVDSLGIISAVALYIYIKKRA